MMQIQALQIGQLPDFRWQTRQLVIIHVQPAQIGQLPDCFRQFGQAISSSLGPIAFDKLAESLGARGVTAATPEALQSELQRALAEKAVTVIHVPIVGGNP